MEVTCPICTQPYDTLKVIPRVIPTCGHTICTICLQIILEAPTLHMCPFDKTSFGLIESPVTIARFPINYALNEVQTFNKNRCETHDEQQCTFLCKTHQQNLCNQCICTKEHRTCDIEPLSKTYTEINKVKSELHLTMMELSTEETFVKSTLQENREKQLLSIHEGFEKWKKLLDHKELDLCQQINFYYDLEQDRVREVIGAGSVFYNEIARHIDSLANWDMDNAKKPDRPSLAEIEKEASQFLEKIRSCNVSEKMAEMENQLSEMFSNFSKALATQVKDTCTLGFSFPDSVNFIVETFTKDVMFYAHPNFPFKNTAEAYLSPFLEDKKEDKNNNWNIEVKADSNPFQVRCKFNFEVTLSDTHSKVLNITTNPKSRLNTIDFEEWNRVKTIKLEFIEPHIENKDLTLLSYIWRRINGPTAINIKIHKTSLVNCLKDVCRILCSGPTNFNAVTIETEEYDFAHARLVKYLICDFLGRMSCLVEIRLLMPGIRLRSREKGNLFQGILLNLSSVKYFNLKLAGSNVLDQDVMPFLEMMPNLQKWHLDLEKTKVTDVVLAGIAQRVLPHMHDLKVFVMNFNNTLITDKGLEELFVNPIKAIQFQFFVSGTRMTDVSLRCVINCLKDSFNTFEILSINFADCRITEETMCSFFHEMKKLKTFTLGLSGTPMTDKVLQAFTNNSLVTMESLRNFAISLDGTNVTDLGVDLLGINLETNLKQLVLSLAKTKVTNLGIDPFVKVKLPEMKSLKGFKMNVTETTVSMEMQAQISKLERTIKEKAASM